MPTLPLLEYDSWFKVAGQAASIHDTKPSSTLPDASIAQRGQADVRRRDLRTKYPPLGAKHEQWSRKSAIPRLRARRAAYPWE